MPSTTTYQNVEQAAEPVRRARKPRKSRTMSGKSEQRDDRNGSSHSRRKGSQESPSLKRGSSSLTSQGSHRSQLVDLVVENREAEEEERAQAQRALGSAWVEPENKHFQ